MVYGREVGGKVLNFEASGALLQASLVMRDRETDSWWSIMTSDAIGGELEGTDLEELPVSEKSTWGAWRQKHPDTLVLSVGGQEHVENNPYDNYFNSDGTFRGLQIDDRRLPPKANVYTFWHDGKPYAVAHESFFGGRIFREGDAAFFFYRKKGESMFSSTRAYKVSREQLERASKPKQLLELAERGELEPLNGFDTFWYSWVAVNANTELLQ